MSADILRRAAALMRERAQALTPAPWWIRSDEVMVAPGFIVAHIASWHPAVALAVADWIDGTAEHIEDCARLGFNQSRYATNAERALAVARAYLGEDS